MPKKSVGTPLRDRFSAGEEGDRELDQVIAVLYSPHLRSLGQSGQISRRGPDLWAGGRSLCSTTAPPRPSTHFFNSRISRKGFKL